MSKKEFKVGDDVLVSGWVCYRDNQKGDKLQIYFGSSRMIQINLDIKKDCRIISHATKKDDTVYEYKYLLHIKNTDYWQETIGYFTSKKEAIRKYISSKPYADVVVSCAQRLTHTKRIRK